VKLSSFAAMIVAQTSVYELRSDTKPQTEVCAIR